MQTLFLVGKGNSNVAEVAVVVIRRKKCHCPKRMMQKIMGRVRWSGLQLLIHKVHKFVHKFCFVEHRIQFHLEISFVAIFLTPISVECQNTQGQSIISSTNASTIPLEQSPYPTLDLPMSKWSRDLPP
mmetsp:Transcript_1211/g.2624  ORF Transcript_1211/g.2624 Transcript_1211/m.2624 type:complete len:128 (-) Transcript_1211:497-880(-)